MTPARLDDRHLRVAEVWDGRSEKVGVRHRVGIEDRHELSAHLLVPRCERAGLEPRALATVEVDHREPSRTELARRLGDDPAGVVGGVVENLNLETVAWVVKSAHSLEQAARNIALVIEGKLHRHRRPLGWRLRRRGLSNTPAVPPVDREQEISVQPLEIKRDHPDEVEESEDRSHSVLGASAVGTRGANVRPPERKRSAKKGP